MSKKITDKDRAEAMGTGMANRAGKAVADRKKKQEDRIATMFNNSGGWNKNK